MMEGKTTMWMSTSMCTKWNFHLAIGIGVRLIRPDYRTA